MSSSRNGNKENGTALPNRKSSGDATPALRARHGSSWLPDRRWEYRGTVIGIWADVGGTFGKQLLTVCLLLATTIPAVASDADSCLHWGKYGLSNFDQWICCYSSAYLPSFLATCATVLFLLAARDLIHKRFYYGLLDVQGVVEYDFKMPLRDPLVALLVWDCFHVLLYAGFVFLLMVKVAAQGSMLQGAPLQAMTALWEPEPAIGFKHRTSFLQSHTLGIVTLEPTTTTPMPLMAHAITTTLFTLPGVHPETATNMYAKLLFVVGVLVPGVLMAIFVCMDYNIVKGLVPLSEYVEDEEEEDNARSLAGLTTVRETGLKQLISQVCKEEDDCRKASLGNDGGAPEHDDNDTFCAIVNFWKRERYRFKGIDLPPVYLLDSLWPGKVIMASGDQRRLENTSARVFRASCKAFFAFALVVLLTIGATLLTMVYAKLVNVVNGRLQSLASVAVMLVHVGVVCVASWRIGTCGRAG